MQSGLCELIQVDVDSASSICHFGIVDLVASMKIFRRLSERGSFSRVAHELGMTQPTVSKSIAALEGFLGVTLFRRSPKGLTMTSAGHTLFELGLPALDRLEAAVAAVKDERLELEGQLKVTSSLAFTRLVLAPLFDEFSALHPGLRLNFVLSDGSVDLIEEGLDLAIRHGKLVDSALKTTKVGRWKRAVFGARSYLKKHRAPRTIEELAGHRLVYYNRSTDRPQWPYIDRDGTKKILSFEPHLQADGSDLIREAVVRGTGLSLLPVWMMTEPERTGTVVRLLESSFPMEFPIYFITHGSRDMTAKQKALIDFLRAKIDQREDLALR
jgi:DNA-binding transcriptional LysR family regulator